MPRRKGIPSYRFHKARNCAVVTIDGKNSYLGSYDSPESYEKYARLIAEWKCSQCRPGVTPTPGRGGAAITVNELLLAFWQHAKQRYVKNGQLTSEIRSFRTALRPVRHLYGREPVTGFGPLALVACRQKLVEAGICRKRINQHVGRIRHAFKWGVAHELVPETTWRALCAVEGLKIGEATETRPVKPVLEAHIIAVRPFVTPQVRAMIDLQLWSGCRPGEACLMRTIDINTQGEIWEYRPHSHKAEHHAKERVVYLGPHAQEIIKPWLRTDLHAYLFSPAEGRAWYQAQRAENRKTPRPAKQRQSTRKPQPKRAPNNRYTPLAYGHAVQRACEAAFGMPKELRRISKELDDDERKRLAGLAAQWRAQHCWHPNQLRHNAASRIRAAYGIEAARVILGHSSAVTSEIYAEIDRDKARDIMGKIG
jgi:integrase